MVLFWVGDFGGALTFLGDDFGFFSIFLAFLVALADHFLEMVASTSWMWLCFAKGWVGGAKGGFDFGMFLVEI